MRILFVHQNFPAQFKHLAPALAARGHELKALAIKGYDIADVYVHRYKPQRSSTAGLHRFATDFETKVIRGEACAMAADDLRRSGYTPDLIIAHPGWGEALFLKDIWPSVPHLHFLEFHYGGKDSDTGFDPEFRKDEWQEDARTRAKNASSMLNLELMDAAYSPTHWQKSSYPDFAKPKIEVVHDGIDTDALTPSAKASLTLESRKIVLRPGMKVVTFINRNLEPYRGYHSFMRALPMMQRLMPDAIFVLIGGDDVSYGARPPAGQTWKQIYLAEMQGQLDLARTVFVGTVPYTVFKMLMQTSAAHVYLTYPFVLSWSMLEAMSCGAPIIGSATPPVQEVIEHGRNGLLVDFFDYENIATTVAEVVNNPHRYTDMRAAARQTIVDGYDLNRICLPRQIDLIERMVR